MKNKRVTTVIQDEILKFEKMSSQWWNQSGSFAPLHKINSARIAYIKRMVQEAMNAQSLKDLQILDVGCGGGLLCEPLARLGANVTGVDASDINIKIAQNHAKEFSPNSKIKYIAGSIENISFKGKFDVVLAMEVVEHVSNYKIFLDDCANLVKKDGLMIVSTINRTLKSLMLAKVAAEHILKWLPIGTHSWQKFLKPSEISLHLHKSSSLQLKDATGLKYRPLKSSFTECKSLDVNYMLCFLRN